MPNLVTFIEREVIPKGHNKNDIIKIDKIKEYFHESDYEDLKLLDNIKVPLSTSTPIFFYPGCGCDILLPLHYFEKLFPSIEEANFIFNDCVDNFTLIKTVLDDIGVSFSENNSTITFYWKNTLINLKFIKEDAFSFKLPEFDIYFEKAFRIMKDQDITFEQRVYQKLKQKGVIISDSGFHNQLLKRLPVSNNLSSYGEMLIGIKQSSASQ